MLEPVERDCAIWFFTVANMHQQIANFCEASCAGLASCKTGPFAWNGIISWWTLLAVFCIWMVAFTTALIRAIRRQAHEANADQQADPRHGDPHV